MIYLKEFDSHSSYESEVNGGGVDFKIPNVSYCNDVNDVHFNPYNLIEFYVGEITGTTPQTVKIYTDTTNHVDVKVSKGNKWYSYVLPKDKGLYKIEGDSVKKVVVKADISFQQTGNFPGNIIHFIPSSTVEASFKGSNTTNVTNISFMFYGCSGLTSLDLSNFNTSKVTDMNNIFSNCSGLTSLDLSNLNTSNVTIMHYMFNYCSGLTSLDVSNFNTSNVTDMGGMFSYCTSLTSLDLSNFNTSKVTNMEEMFDGCSGLKSLDLSKFNTSNVTNMNYMFGRCSGLTELNLSGWDMSNVTSMNAMFSGCNALRTIRMIGCSPSTIDKIRGVKPSSATIVTGQTI